MVRYVCHMFVYIVLLINMGFTHMLRRMLCSRHGAI